MQIVGCAQDFEAGPAHTGIAKFSFEDWKIGKHDSLTGVSGLVLDSCYCNSF
jgi:hypothetical protein